MTSDADGALLIAVSRRHLDEASDICERSGAVALPLLSAGDLVSAPDGSLVLVLAVADGDEESRAVSWRATLRSWSNERPASGVPSTVDLADPPTTESCTAPSDHDEGRDDGPDETREEPVWIVLGELRELAMRERIHTNELVRKQDRGARYFVPRAPRLVHVPD